MRGEKKGRGKREMVNIRFFCIPLILIFCQIFTYNPAFAIKKTPIQTPKRQYKYEQKILRQEEIEKYKRSILPESGYMTTDDYEKLSKDIPNSDKVVPPPPTPRDIKMKYIPQAKYKLTRYNDPPGVPELHLLRRFQFDRQMNCTGIISPNKDIMVYPTVYYYAINQCTSGDLFIIPLDKTLTEVERAQRANVIKRIPQPILSTDKNIQEKFTFRTMTPIDFSPDGSKLLAKEKIGNVNDGIWKTNVWIYDFDTKQAKELPEIREAIKFYWKNSANLLLDDKRWDINPLGFDAKDPERIVVSAYAYTGKEPAFLGNWSIDCKGERSLLESLFEPKAQITVSGLKLEKDGVIDPTKVYKDEKQLNKKIKKDKKAAKKAIKKDHKLKKKALKKKLHEMKVQENAALRNYNSQQRKSGTTGEN